MNSGPRYKFGAFVLIPAEQTLLRGDEPVRLTRMDFALLLMLVERAGHLVRKDELLQRLWPGTIVEEGNLAKHVSMLRKALGDREDTGRLIETVPRVGFRFVAPVESMGLPPPAHPPVPEPRRPVNRRVAGTLVLIAVVLFGFAVRANAPGTGLAILIAIGILGLSLWTSRGEFRSEPINERHLLLAILVFSTLGLVGWATTTLPSSVLNHPDLEPSGSVTVPTLPR